MGRQAALENALAQMKTDDLVSFADVTGDITKEGVTHVPWEIHCSA